MGHMHVAGFWRGLGLAMAAFLLGALGQGVITWAATQGPQEELGENSQHASQGLAPAHSILDVMLNPESLGTKVVVIGDGEFKKYKVSVLREPLRLVLDLWGVQKYKVDTKKLPPTKEVARVRIGRHQDRMRLVMDMADTSAPQPPLYSVQLEGSNLVLRVGELAKLSPMNQPEPPATEEARIQGLPPTESWNVGEVKPLEVPELGSQKQRLLSQEGSQGLLQPSQEDLQALFAKVWDPKASEPAEQSVWEKTKSNTSSLTFDPAISVKSLPEPEERSQNKAPGNLVVSLPDKKSTPIVETEVPRDTARPAWPYLGPREPARGDSGTPGHFGLPQITRVSEARGQEAFSLAQVAAKSPAKTPLPALKIEEEEEEDFKISTGMEPGKVYTGQRLDLDLQDIDLDNVFRLLAEVSNLNIIVSDKVKGKLTMRLKNVPWDQALDLILSTQKLGMVRQGNVLRVAPLKDLTDEEKERKRLRQERIQAKIEAEKRIQEAEIEAQERQRKLRPFVTEFLVLNYTKAKDFQSQIKDVLTKKERGIEREGKAVVDERTNTVTVTDYPETIERIKQYKEMVDKPTPQVLIEARIVKASKNFARELGVQWGTQFAEFDRKNEWAWGISSATSTTGTPPTAPSAWRSGAFRGGTGHDFFPLSGWMVNLPATILPGPPGIGLQIGRLAGDLINLDLRLSAAEREGLTKIVSRPKVMTLDNVEATIKQGREIPFTQVNPEGNVSVVYKEASLKTTVTPHISPDGRVRLKLDVTDDFPDRANANPITGNPEIVKRQGTTEVLVRDGETVVIGGVLEETRATSEDGVPWLKDVPGLSWLFERKQRRTDQTELLIFVTPFVVQQT
ncbi:MAG: type IV pilus secretin PilQ [bacterium]